MSFALKLRKRKRGASQTQRPKNAAISVKPGTSVRTLYDFNLLASFVRRAK